jgi:hypothetical protein
MLAPPAIIAPALKLHEPTADVEPPPRVARLSITLWPATPEAWTEEEWADVGSRVTSAVLSLEKDLRLALRSD